MHNLGSLNWLPGGGGGGGGGYFVPLEQPHSSCSCIGKSGAHCFCPGGVFVCLSVLNFNLLYNFLTPRDRDFIFCVFTSLMMPL